MIEYPKQQPTLRHKLEALLDNLRGNDVDQFQNHPISIHFQVFDESPRKSTIKLNIIKLK